MVNKKIAGIGIIIVIVLLLAMVFGLSSLMGYPKEKVIIQSFYSPTCPWCEKQKPILATVIPVFGEKVELEDKCIPVHEGDAELCIKELMENGMDFGEASKKFEQNLEDAKNAGVFATPTLIFNGTMKNYLNEQELKNGICSALYGPFYFGEKKEQCI
jgi:protein-disulfide isomerase